MTQDEHDRLVKVEEKTRGNTRRIENLEKHHEDLEKLISSVATIAQKQVDMDSDLKEIKCEVKTLNARPAKRWDGIVDKAILAAVGVLVAYIAVKVGLA